MMYYEESGKSINISSNILARDFYDLGNLSFKQFTIRAPH